ncbi:MAG: hypothetical protein WCB11_25040 [Terriglobales bacterium]
MKTLFEQIPVAVVKKTVVELQQKQEIDDRNLKANSSAGPNSLARQQSRCRTAIRK